MTETSDGVRAVQQTRRRALVIPREHGAWGLLLVPLFTGVVAGFASEHRIWPLLLLTVAALSLFWLRTPVKASLVPALWRPIRKKNAGRHLLHRFSWPLWRLLV